MRNSTMKTLMGAIVIITMIVGIGFVCETKVAAKPIVIAYAQAELVNAWRVTNQKDMEAWAKKLDVKLISLDANQDPAKQLSDIQNMLAQRPDALILSPLESAALVALLDT